jgi:polyisoprenoid-binding protein YceI
MGDHPLLSEPGRWRVDPAATRAAFTARSLWGLVAVRGGLVARDGNLLIQPNGVAGELVLDAASVDTGNRLRDFHLRTRDYFDSSRHPDVRFALEELTAVGPERIAVVGELTVAGQGAPVTFACATLVQGARRVQLTSKVEVDRRSFAMSGGQLPGLVPAGVELSLAVVLDRV